MSYLKFLVTGKIFVIISSKISHNQKQYYLKFIFDKFHFLGIFYQLNAKIKTQILAVYKKENIKKYCEVCETNEFFFKQNT